MSDGDVITYNEDGVWKTRVEGNSRASRISADRGDAVAFGRRVARERGVRHIVLDPAKPNPDSDS
ncbi:DUF2188 domain-containing protein [Kutzneria kofuensis]|uniref:DUF2188 domain-containing protein n=1 Tax=Kutzneria kofuensis TaxID=103725 RepID=A0A7W9NM97_9PSEU|nr:DUF2188 domain-containing protein [Kutzneria kofuensis]MBB5897113.1 hypothetical protein [Kutzneria kofuensis]